MRKLKLNELGRKTIVEFQKSEKTPIVLVADNIRSGMNVGSLFRTADAFALERIILCGISATPPHKEIMKTAIGASKSIKWEHQAAVKDAIVSLKEEGYIIVGIEQTTDSVLLQDTVIDQDNKYAIVMGNEVMGISDEILPLLDLAVEIPQFGTKHSLNVSVCAGVVVWEYWRKLNKIS